MCKDPGNKRWGSTKLSGSGTVRDSLNDKVIFELSLEIEDDREKHGGQMKKAVCRPVPVRDQQGQRAASVWWSRSSTWKGSGQG